MRTGWCVVHSLGIHCMSQNFAAAPTDWVKYELSPVLKLVTVSLHGRRGTVHFCPDA